MLLERMWPLLLVMPAAILMIGLFFYPLGALFLESARPANIANYAYILTNSTYASVLGNTMKIALLVTIIDLVIAYPVAFYIASLSKMGRLIAFFFVLLPLWSSQLVRTYAWMVMLGRNGPINKSLIAIGIIDQPLRLSNNEFAVVIGMVHILLPFMVLPIYSSVAKIDRNLVHAAYGLGASSIKVLWRILLPLTIRGVTAGVGLVLVLSIGVFIMPAILGGGRVPVLPLLIEQQAAQFLNWPFAGALSAVLLVIVLGILGLMSFAADRLAGGAKDAR